MNKPSKVYVILVNYKGHLDTIECLESLLKLEYDNFQVIVVDNSPSTESIEYLKSWGVGTINNVKTQYESIIYPLSKKPIDATYLDQDNFEAINGSLINKISFIKANENKGFASANNIGLRYVMKQNEEDCLAWLLNNDTIVLPDSLNELVNLHVNTNKVGIVGSRLMYYHQPDHIQALGGAYNKLLALSSHIAEGLTPKEVRDIPKPDYIVGASMLVNRTFLKEVGTMSEDFFLYYEEIDWATRALKGGWLLANSMESVVYHKEGSSIGGSNLDVSSRSLLSDYFQIKNRIVFTKKYYPFFLPIVVISMLGVCVNRVLRNQYDRVWMIIKIILNVDSRPIVD